MVKALSCFEQHCAWRLKIRDRPSFGISFIGDGDPIGYSVLGLPSWSSRVRHVLILVNYANLAS